MIAAPSHRRARHCDKSFEWNTPSRLEPPRRFDDSERSGSNQFCSFDMSRKIHGDCGDHFGDDLKPFLDQRCNFGIHRLPVHVTPPPCVRTFPLPEVGETSPFAVHPATG